MQNNSFFVVFKLYLYITAIPANLTFMGFFAFKTALWLLFENDQEVNNVIFSVAIIIITILLSLKFSASRSPLNNSQEENDAINSLVDVTITINSELYNDKITLNRNSILLEAYKVIEKRLYFDSNRCEYYFIDDGRCLDINDSQIRISKIIKDGIIHMKRVLYVTVKLDEHEMLRLEFDDLNIPLSSVRKRLNEFTSFNPFFNFWSPKYKRYLEEGEEDIYYLGGILDDNDNTLHISHYNCTESLIKKAESCGRIKVTIHKHLPSNEPEKFYEILSLENKKLNYVRSLLKMGPNLIFCDGDVKIRHHSEDFIEWTKIVWAENRGLHLKILQVNNQDWNELIKQCEYGFTFEDSRIQLAKLQAFSIDITKIDPRHYDRSEQTEYKNEKSEGNSSKESLTFKNEITAKLPLSYLSYLSLFGNISSERMEEFIKSRDEKISSSSNVKFKSVLEFDATNIDLTKEFINEVKLALDKTLREEKIKELKKISRRYGQFYANKVFYGAASIKTSENINTRNNGFTDTNFKVAGGAGSDEFVKFQAEVDHKSECSTSKVSDISKMKSTIVGGEDPEHWQIIYYDIRPIFELLGDDLKDKVLKAFGKRILKSGITTHKINLQDPTVIIEWDNESKDLISNPVHECRIFASLMQQDKNHRYYLRVHYIDEHTPAFVVHGDNGKKNRNKSEREIQIGWIIIGYSKTFKEDCTIECEEFENNLSFTNKCMIECEELKNNLSFMNKYKLMMCVTECPDGPSEYNLYKSKVVASVHFSSENSACLLVHNLDKENNVNDNNYIKAKILFGYIDKESLKRLTGTIIDVNIKHDRTLKKEWKSLLAGDENFISSDGKRKNFIYPLFMNVTNNCRLVNTIPNNNCNQHGLVIATPKHLIYHPLFSENLNFEINVSILLLKKIK